MRCKLYSVGGRDDRDYRQEIQKLQWQGKVICLLMNKMAWLDIF